MAKQVLIIDDDQNTVKYLSVVLSENGYDPVSACDGNEGLQKIKQAKPDLIVLDVMMPKKIGVRPVQATQEGRAVQGHPDSHAHRRERNPRGTGESQGRDLRAALRQPSGDPEEDDPGDARRRAGQAGDVRGQAGRPRAFVAKVQQLIGS